MLPSLEADSKLPKPLSEGEPFPSLPHYASLVRSLKHLNIYDIISDKATGTLGKLHRHVKYLEMSVLCFIMSSCQLGPENEDGRGGNSDSDGMYCADKKQGSRGTSLIWTSVRISFC